MLLADDEPTILLTLRAILELQGYEVDTANSGAQAVQKLEDSEFHLVITDMRMEEPAAGFAVAAAAKSRPYKPAVAILTAYPEAARDWRSKGADMLFIKPANTEDMLRAIESLLSSRYDRHAGAQL